MLLVVVSMLAWWVTAFAQKAPKQDYLIYALSESADEIALIRFGSNGAKVERELTTGVMELDIDGPRGIAVSPGNSYAFIS